MKHLEFIILNKNDEEFENKRHEDRLSRCDRRPVREKGVGQRQPANLQRDDVQMGPSCCFSIPTDS